MAGRVRLTKRVRFEVFKRDGFVCQYCGAHPPAVILHVDHIHPVADGGTNDIENLITACECCNLGKGAKHLSDAPASFAERAENLKEREQQLFEYQKLLKFVNERITNEINLIEDRFSDCTDRGFTEKFRKSVERFLNELGFIDVDQAMEIAIDKFYEPEKTVWTVEESEQIVRYFCGICWKKIRNTQGGES